MHTQLSYSLAEQHIDELRAGADRRRLVAQATLDRPAAARQSSMRVARRAVRLARRLALTFAVASAEVARRSTGTLSAPPSA